MGPRFLEAVALANELHGSKLKKGTSVSYISHLLCVAGIVMEAEGDEEMVIAALLHDAVEDAGGRPTLERIRAKFGDGVAEIVDACSDTDVTPKPPWKERKQAYIDAIPHKSHQARVVSLADKVHNVGAILSDYREVGEALWGRFNAGREEQLWYYRELADAFNEYEPGPLARRLDKAVRELEAACPGSWWRRVRRLFGVGAE